MSTFLLLTVTGVGLAAMYFLIASGLLLLVVSESRRRVAV